MAKSRLKEDANLRRQKMIRREWQKFGIEAVGVLVAAYVLAYFFFGSYAMQEASMNPTLETGDRVCVNRAAYTFAGVHRGDVIAFESNDSADSSIHIKRVIGLPGETIQIQDGQILINGKTYLEDQDFPAISNPGNASEEIILGDKEYFVLGDNRNNSEDSRFSDVGLIDKDQIKGKAWLIVSPASNRGLVR